LDLYPWRECPWLFDGRLGCKGPNQDHRLDWLLISAKRNSTHPSCITFDCRRMPCWRHGDVARAIHVSSNGCPPLETRDASPCGVVRQDLSVKRQKLPPPRQLSGSWCGHGARCSLPPLNPSLQECVRSESSPFPTQHESYPSVRIPGYGFFLGAASVSPHAYRVRPMSRWERKGIIENVLRSFCIPLLCLPLRVPTSFSIGT